MRFRVLSLLALVVVLPGCGGGDGPPTGPSSPTPPPTPVRTVIDSGSEGLSVEHFIVIPFTTSGVGTLDATVDWTFSADLLLMYVTQGTCTGTQFAADACPDQPSCECRFAVRSENPFEKPRVMTIANAAAGPYTLIVWNLGPRDESISYTIALTR